MSLKKTEKQKSTPPPQNPSTLYKMKNSVICPNGFSLEISQNKRVFSCNVFKKHLNGAAIANQEILVKKVALLLLRDSLYAVVHLEGYSFEYLMGNKRAFCIF